MTIKHPLLLALTLLISFCMAQTVTPAFNNYKNTKPLNLPKDFNFSEPIKAKDLKLKNDYLVKRTAFLDKELAADKTDDLLDSIFNYSNFNVRKKLKFIRTYKDSLTAPIHREYLSKRSEYAKEGKVAFIDTLDDEFKQAEELINGQIKVIRDEIFSVWVQESRFRFLPTRNTIFARNFYGSNFDWPVEPLKNNFLQYNNRAIGVYSELINAPVGPLRFSLGSFFSRSQFNSFTNLDSLFSLADTTQSKAAISHFVDSLYKIKTDSLKTISDKAAAIDNLISNGGNIMLITSLPVFDVDNSRRNAVVKYTMYLTEKAAFNLPGLGAGVTKFSYLNDLAIESFLSFNFTNTAAAKKEVAQRGLSGFINFKASLLCGTKDFLESIDLSDVKVALFMGNLKFGLNIADNVQLYGRYTFSNLKRLNQGTNNFTFGLGITPTNLKKN